MLVGYVGRAVGLKGDVEVAVQSDAPDRFAVGAVVLLADGLRPLTVERSRTQKDRFVVGFTEITDRTTAERLKGAELVIPADAARPLEDGEYWDHDLVGCAVVDGAGTELGRVDDVMHQPSGSLLVVRAGDAQHLIPLVADIVKDVQPGVRIVIDPIPGLLDD